VETGSDWRPLSISRVDRLKKKKQEEEEEEEEEEEQQQQQQDYDDDDDDEDENWKAWFKLTTLTLHVHWRETGLF